MPLKTQKFQDQMAYFNRAAQADTETKFQTMLKIYDV